MGRLHPRRFEVGAQINYHHEVASPAKPDAGTLRAHDSAGPLPFTPIGWVRSPYQRRFGTPQQSAASGSEAEAIIELEHTIIPQEAIAELEGFERIWLVSWLHRSGTWAPTVRPPRGARRKRSLFATRSPDRPNPIGLSAVRLVAVEELRLRVRGIDLLDGTPILDIKPYVPYADAFPEARAGWLDDVPFEAPQIARR